FYYGFYNDELRLMKSSKILFSENLKRLRLARSWTQAYASEIVGVDQSAYQRWESGQTMPDPFNLDSLVRVFKVPLYAFFASDEPVQPTIQESLKVICKELGFEAPKPIKKKKIRSTLLTGPFEVDEGEKVPDYILAIMSQLTGKWD